jgi:RND family efflux transporter MFP subunit
MEAKRGFGSVRSAALLLCLTVLATACSRETPVVSLPPPEVAVAQPVVQEAIEHFATTGRMAAVEQVDVRARVGGYLVAVNFVDGADVKNGDVLFEIDPRPFAAEVMKAEGEVAKWQAQLRKAEADVVRNSRLLPKGAASERDLEQSIAAKESAQAAIMSAKAQLTEAKLNLEFSQVKAPIDGRASRTTVTKGNLILPIGQQQSEPLTTLVRLDPIYAYFDVDERTLLRVRGRAQAANAAVHDGNVVALQVPVEIGLAGDDGFPHRGVLDFVDNRVDPSTGTLQARAVFDNQRRMLAPGMFVRVRMPIGRRENAVFVPERAIGTDQGNKYVLTVSEQNVVEYRAVKLGIETGGLREIVSGLEAGSRVITDGIQRVRPGLTVQPRSAAEAPAKAAAGAGKAIGH